MFQLNLTGIITEEIFARKGNLLVNSHDFPYVFTVFLLTSVEVWNPQYSIFEFHNVLSIPLPQSSFQKRTAAELF